MKATFLRELRAGLVPDALVLLFALGAFVALERAMVNSGQPTREAQQVIDLVLLGIAALMSFASGARAFSAEVKTRRLLSLYTMPISRGALWCALVGGRLLAITVALSGLLLVRPSILRTLVQPDPTFGTLPIWLLALILVLFAAGTCSALCFESTLAVYLVGYPIAIFSLFQTLGLVNTGFSSWLPSGFANWFWALALASIFLAFLGFSWWLLRSGDFTAWRRRLAKQAFLAIALLSLQGMVGVVTSSPLLADPFRPSSRSWRGYPGRLVSSGGLYLAVPEKLTRRPEFSRVTIVETTTGRTLATQTWRNLMWASWSSQEQVLSLLVLEHRLPEPWGSLLGRPQIIWIRLSPGGRELSRFRFRNPLGVTSLSDGTDLAIDYADGRVRLLSLENKSTPSVLAELPSPGEVRLVPLHRRGAIVFELVSPDSAGRIWRVENRMVREINALAASFRNDQNGIRSRSFSQAASIQSTLNQIFGRPGSSGEEAMGAFLEPTVLESDDLSTSVAFFVQDGTTRSLWTRSLKAAGWERRAAGLALDDSPRYLPGSHPLDLNFVRQDQRPSISLSESLVVYLPIGGLDGRASLYDGLLDREIPLSACEGSRAAFPELFPTLSGPAFLVRFQCSTLTPPQEKVLVRTFYYLPGSGKVKPLPDLNRAMRPGPLHLAYLDETTVIWRAENSEAWQVLRNGKLHALWPSVEGETM